MRYYSAISNKGKKRRAKTAIYFDTMEEAEHSAFVRNIRAHSKTYTLGQLKFKAYCEEEKEEE